MFDLIDVLLREGRPLSLAEAVTASGWPKPTVHRLLSQLEAGGLLMREPDGRRYTLAPRLLRMSEEALASSSQHGVRHAVLRQLVADVGESCNYTMLSGGQVLYWTASNRPFRCSSTCAPAHGCRCIARPVASC